MGNGERGGGGEREEEGKQLFFDVELDIGGRKKLPSVPGLIFMKD